MTYFHSKFRTIYSLSAKAALLSASAFCVSACVTSYAGATHAAPVKPVAVNTMAISSPQTVGLISAQTDIQFQDRPVSNYGLVPLSAEAAMISQAPAALAVSPMPALPVATQSSAIIAKPTHSTLTNSIPANSIPANSILRVQPNKNVIASGSKSQTVTKAIASAPEIALVETETAIVKMADAQTAKPMDTEPMRSEKMSSGKMEKTDMKSETTMKQPASQTQSPMNTLLGQYVKAPDAMGVARFDYAGLKASQSDQAILADYIKTLEAKDPSTLSAAEATAYWANLYNAVTIKVVIDNYPVQSIKEIRSGAFSAGPWKKKLTTVNGNPMTLDEIEHETLRKKYPSPLIHYMVNCASIGCPNLKNSLWEAKTLDADRDAAARVFVNSLRGAKVTSKGLVVSSIYDWFQEDFGGSKAGVLEHLSQYATGDLKAAIDGGAKIKSFDYDWTLNE